MDDVTTKSQLIFDAHFGKHFNLTSEMRSFLEASFKPVNYTSREMMVEAGGYARYFYFVISGVQAIYYLDEKGNKNILGFSFDGSVSGAYDAFIKNETSQSFLESITPSEMIAINRDDFMELFERFPEFYKWRAHFMEDILFGRLFREVELTVLPAKDRFDAFVKRCPPQLLQIPQKYLASYLNMKPETFSRLRALHD